jgi:hypothetical protein
LNVLIACRQSSGVAKRQDGKEKPETSWIQRHEMLLVFVLMLISLAVIAVFIAPDIMPSAAVPESVSDFSVNVISSGGPDIDAISCLAARGVDRSTLVYVYSDTCAYSQMNTPWVMALPARGYSVFLADTANTSAMAIVSSCLRDTAALTGTPEYVCPATGASNLGAFASEVELENFAKACR